MPFHRLNIWQPIVGKLAAQIGLKALRKNFNPGGYDPTLWLPVVTGAIVRGGDASARSLPDPRRTVADLITEHHYDRFAALAAEHV